VVACPTEGGLAAASTAARELSTVVMPAFAMLMVCCSMASWQGRTLVHYSAQRKRFLWDRGCIYGLFRGLGGV